VQSLDCRYSDLDKTLSEIKQIRIENSTAPAPEHLSMEPTCSINSKRAKKPPKTRSDDFYGHCLSISWVVC
jgi:hypothetical protein